MQYTEIRKKKPRPASFDFERALLFLSLAFIWKLLKYLKFGKSIIK